MGSGKKRKENDAPIIRRPVKRIALSIGIRDSGGSAADTCIPSFDTRIENSNITVEGVKVRLQKQDTLYAIFAGEQVVGYLTDKYSDIVAKCIELGVRYIGKIIIKNNIPYARFTRVSK
jgi:hypothetical protein